MKVFITWAWGDIWWAIYKVLSSNKSISYIAIWDINEWIYLNSINIPFFKLERADNAKYIKNLIKILKKYNIDILIPTTEIEIKVISENISAFFDFKVLINDKNILDVFFDKYLTYKYLNEHNFLVPKSYTKKSLNNNEWKINYPVILKERCSSWSKLIYKINNKNELNKKILLFNKPIIQELLYWEELTCTVFSDWYIYNVICFSRTLWSWWWSNYVKVFYDIKLNNYLINIAKKINLKWSINIQWKYNNWLFNIFEINPRISSTILFKHMAWFEELSWLINNKKAWEYVLNKKFEWYAHIEYSFKN